MKNTLIINDMGHLYFNPKCMKLIHRKVIITMRIL